MSIIGDLKFVVGLGAIGAIGYGAYKIYKKIPDVQKGAENAFNQIETDFNQVVGDFQKDPVGAFKEYTPVGQGVKFIEDISVDTKEDIEQSIASFVSENSSITFEDTLDNPTIQKRLGNDSGGLKITRSPKYNVGKGRI